MLNTVTDIPDNRRQQWIPLVVRWVQWTIQRPTRFPESEVGMMLWLLSIGIGVVTSWGLLLILIGVLGGSITVRIGRQKDLR